jgi:hypothetical protein
MVMRSKSVVPVILMMVAITALVVASSSARPLSRNAPAGESAVAVAVDSGSESILQLLKPLYLQNLQAGPGASCTTNSPNVKCSPPMG